MLLDLLAPPLCWSCRAPAARGSALCRDCRGSLRFLSAAAGASPGAPAPPPWAAVAYEGPARDLVGALKFRGATAIAGELAALMVANAPPELLAGALVPVPLHPARERERGFNQAALIAQAISERTGLPVADVLLRSGPAERQVGRDRAARLSGPSGEIRVSGSPLPQPGPPPLAPPSGRPPSAPPGPPPPAPPSAEPRRAPPVAVLVDDVVTTGATLSACAAALRGAGSVHVAAVAFARTVGR